MQCDSLLSSIRFTIFYIWSGLQQFRVIRKMVSFTPSRLVLLCWALSVLCFKGLSDDSEVSVKFLKAPRAFSHLKTATFTFEALVRGKVSNCSNSSISCKLDGGAISNCGGGKVLYEGLQDGNHALEVCVNRSQRVGCAAYNWTVDTLPPKAYVVASTSFTNALDVSVNITFTEPCTGGGGFGCPSVNACNLLVYGSGEVIPSSFTTLQPNLKYSLKVAISPSVQYGRLILVMDKNFCTDAAGNRFTRAENSSFFVHFDRRNVFVDLRTHVPERILKLNDEARTVQATNNRDILKVYLYFSEPVVNSSAEILNSINISEGALLPISGESFSNRRFGFQVVNVSSIAVVTVSLQSKFIISRSWTPVSPVAPVNFLYGIVCDIQKETMKSHKEAYSQRPSVRLSTPSNERTTKESIPVSIKFWKPVFGFNSSSLSISGGNLLSFREISKRNYHAEIQADNSIISISVPQNVTGDVAGNRNLPSNVLQVKRYSIPMISSVVSTFATATFLGTSFVAGLLTLSTASLLCVGAFARPSSLLISEPTRNLFRSLCHIQVFAMSRWLAVTLPVEYYELARGLQWSIPYFSLPWESNDSTPVMGSSNSSVDAHSYFPNIYTLASSHNMQLQEEDSKIAASVYGLPLTAMEYRRYFEIENIVPEAHDITDAQHFNEWKEFDRSMFWLTVIVGSLILLHVLFLLLIRFKRRNSDKKWCYGALAFPRFELFLTIFALPCICRACAALVRGGTTSGVITGILLLGVVGFLLLSLLLVLSIGITFGKLLQYKEVHQVGQKFHWYQELIRVTLGPGKRGQWTWKNQSKSSNLIKLGALFEDLRGPPKYMLSQIAGSNLRKQRDRIIESEDETEDSEAPFIQRVFGILRIYYTVIESVKRVTLGIVAGAYLDRRQRRTPTVILFCITSFQIIFILMKKPFIKKKVQLVEIVSVSCQVGIFCTCLVLEVAEKELSTSGERKVGIFMVALFLIGFLTQMINEWYALYRQMKRLDLVDQSFLIGLKTASVGILLLFIPQKMSKNLEDRLLSRNAAGENGGETGSSADRNKSSESMTSDKPWQKQLRELAKASFTRDGKSATGTSDPSTSRGRWTEFWKRSGSSSYSSDSKARPAKPNRLTKDLEDIFASK